MVSNSNRCVARGVNQNVATTFSGFEVHLLETSRTDTSLYWSSLATGALPICLISTAKVLPRVGAPTVTWMMFHLVICRPKRNAFSPPKPSRVSKCLVAAADSYWDDLTVAKLEKIVKKRFATNSTGSRNRGAHRSTPS
jgi:hypothetical protein